MMLAAATLSFTFPQGRSVLDGVSLNIEPGITAIVGPNGVGKTTLLRLLAGVLTPTSGRVTLHGRELGAIPARERARSIAYVAQRSALSAGFSVREVVTLGRFAGVRDDSAIDRAMATMSIRDEADRPFGTLSAGQQQRAALARALAQLEGPGGHSRILLADEPLAAMDPEHRLATCDVLRACAAKGWAVVLVVHDLTLARRWADKAAVLTEGGTLAAHGTAAETLRADLLEQVFRVRFAETATAGGPVIVADARTSSDAGRR